MLRKHILLLLGLYAALAGGLCTYVWLTKPEYGKNWQEHATLGVPREGGAVAVHNGKFYIFSGYETLALTISGRSEVYDPQTKTWTQLSTMLHPVTHMSAVVVGDEVWFGAGYIGDAHGAVSDLIQIYDIPTDSWRLGPPIPRKVGSAQMVLLEGKLHLMGGTDGTRQLNLPHHYVLDMNAQEQGWKELAPMPMGGRSHFSTAVVDGKIYILGGEFGHDVISEDIKLVHRYDPKMDSWERLKDLPKPCSHAEQSTFVLDGKIVMVGGKSYRELTTSDVRVYDPVTQETTIPMHLPVALYALSAAYVDGQIIVAYGGEQSYKYFSKRMWTIPFSLEGAL